MRNDERSCIGPHQPDEIELNGRRPAVERQRSNRLPDAAGQSIQRAKHKDRTGNAKLGSETTDTVLLPGALVVFGNLGTALSRCSKTVTHVAGLSNQFLEAVDAGLR